MGVDLETQRKTALEMATRLFEAKKLYKQGVELLQKEDYPAAGDAISRAAEMGDSTAQCHLGFLYENGFFGDGNEGAAVKWYRKAADQCLPHGQFRLGACYQLGKGVEQDWEEAARLFDLAAKMGHTDAAECLANLREMGGVSAAVPKPEVEAREEQPKRAKEEPPPMPPLTPDLDDPAVTDAVAAYQVEALKNNAPAQLKLGLAYHVGRSVPANPKLACFWVMRSMLAGDQTAAQYLQYCTRAVPPEQHGPLQAKIFMWAPGQPVPQL